MASVRIIYVIKFQDTLGLLPSFQIKQVSSFLIALINRTTEQDIYQC